jgi:dipeptidyl aminopeptidase/acylaminoacyl peptidase
MWGALTVAAGFIVFAANSAGIDGTGVLFALANAVAFGFGYTKSRP